MNDSQITKKALGNNTLVLDPGISLDNDNAHLMVEAMSAALSDGIKYIIIDMTRLEFISSAGVGSILGTVEEFREIGGDIILCNIGDSVLQVLNVLDLKEYFTIKATDAEALQFCN